ncbi:interleukin-2 receptor subunit beta [Amia ocellicauda]|uniref:interleukin-2 receptor subunit beta n=1 Tax=Amia ocellicauda TaxID=2972642 RepID=UPI003463F1C2|nr:IL9R protein [Amia calva]
MKSVCLTALLVTLATASVHTNPSPDPPSLMCVTDYLTAITCHWHSTGHPSSDCTLHTDKWNKQLKAECKLTASHDSDSSFRSCTMCFGKNPKDQVFSYIDNLQISVQCPSSSQPVAQISGFRPPFNVKMHPPTAPTVNRSVLSWHEGPLVSELIQPRSFQFMFKCRNQSWEEAFSSELTEDKRLQLDERGLQMGAQYQARVRVQPTLNKGFEGQWSDWSPITEWTSDVGYRVNGIHKVMEGPDMQDSLIPMLVLAISATAGLCCTVLICGYRKPRWAYKGTCLHVPDPSKYFDPLVSVHEGNFQKWLSPLFTPESFDTLREEQCVSPVEVYEKKGGIGGGGEGDTTCLWPKEYPLQMRGPWELSSSGSNSGSSNSSGQSSCFSNMGYFFSQQHPGSYDLEPCPVYFSYQPGVVEEAEGEKEGEEEEEEEESRQRGEDGEDAEVCTPICPCSSYERLDPQGKRLEEAGGGVSAQGWGPASPPAPFPPGLFRPPLILLPPLTLGQDSLPQQQPQLPHSAILLPHLPFPPHLRGLGLGAFGLGGLGGLGQGVGDDGGGGGGVEPSGGGYLSVRDVQGCYSNQSV